MIRTLILTGLALTALQAHAEGGIYGRTAIYDTGNLHNITRQVEPAAGPTKYLPKNETTSPTAPHKN